MIDKSKTYQKFSLFEWIDVIQPDAEDLFEIAEEYQLDVYQIKDSLQLGHLPKIEKLPNYHFMIVRAFTSTIEQGATTVSELTHKIAFFYNDKKVITVHQSRFPFLENISKSFVSSEEFVLFIIHKMVLSYEKPLDELDMMIDYFEKTIFLNDYSKVSLEDLYYLKTQTRITKKILLLFQHVVVQMEVTPDNYTSLQDIKDHLVNLLMEYDEILENANNLLNTYHSVYAKKTNDVMKLLTVFSAFFLPLTFIVGVYGMNFHNMPELNTRYGYFVVLGVMILLSILIFYWFKKKKIL